MLKYQKPLCKVPTYCHARSLLSTVGAEDELDEFGGNAFVRDKGTSRTFLNRRHQLTDSLQPKASSGSEGGKVKPKAK